MGSSPINYPYKNYAVMVELVDTLDLGSNFFEVRVQIPFTAKKFNYSHSSVVE